MENMWETYRYDGEGLQISYSNPAWMVGIKNYKPASDVANMNALERHLLTDELFAPVTEGSVLVVKPAEDGAPLTVQPMAVGSVYAIPKGQWHNVVMRENGKLILAECSGTGVSNSEFYPLNESMREELRSLVAKL